MNQFWKTIVPVKGEPIPEGAEANVYSGMWAKSTLIRPGLTEFIPDDLNYGWRVPVECVPIDVVVDAFMQDCEWDAAGYFVYVRGKKLIAESPEALQAMVLAKLRQLAAESVTT